MLPRALLLAAVVIWGWTFVATKVLLAELGPLEIFALRLAIGLPFLGIVLLVKRAPLRFTCDDLRPLLLGAAVFTLHFLVQITGMVSTSATNTSWIVSVSPLALAVLSFVFLRERIGWRGVAGIAIATAGILLLVSHGRLADLGWLRSTGDWLVLASAHTWALYTVATRDLSRRRDPLAVTFAILLIAAAFTSLLFVTLADFASVRGLSLRGGVALLYLEPLATLTLAVPLLHEPFGPFVVLGGGLVLAGVYVGQREPHPDGLH